MLQQSTEILGTTTTIKSPSESKFPPQKKKFNIGIKSQHIIFTGLLLIMNSKISNKRESKNQSYI